MNQYKMLVTQEVIQKRDTRLRAQSAYTLEIETEQAESLTIEETQEFIETILIELGNISLSHSI